jgi:hypothetical protein
MGIRERARFTEQELEEARGRRRRVVADLQRQGPIDSQGQRVKKEMPPDMQPTSKCTLPDDRRCRPTSQRQVQPLPCVETGLDPFNADDSAADLSRGSCRNITPEMRTDITFRQANAAGAKGFVPRSFQDAAPSRRVQPIARL